MKVAFAFLALVAFASAVEPKNEPIPILRSSEDPPSPDGSYSYSFETGNGIKAEEKGHVKDLGGEHEAMQVKGSYSYQAEDGSPISVSYTADENGFQPKGDHIPQPPQSVLRMLEWLALHPEEEDPEFLKASAKF
ncbi:cuticle protein CP14.6-like [Copidosoma floridanum]|uniref:cuticle protein CP14.6-like n=1 Tax=Copidosoma floridanum TaxID=29053 RepID=UPI0006C9AA35|nr:cuticle protein CP14.6-like [Copidosoma floridanum]